MTIGYMAFETDTKLMIHQACLSLAGYLANLQNVGRMSVVGSLFSSPILSSTASLIAFVSFALAFLALEEVHVSSRRCF